MHTINIHHLENISILGLGISTIAALDFLKNNCSHLKTIHISDIKKREDFAESLLSEIETKFQDYELKFEFGQQSFDFITANQESIDKHNSFIMLSPGIPPRTPIIKELQESNFLIGTDFDLFTESICLDEKFDHKAFSTDDEHIADYVAVTGTNGKTTTTSLIAHILGTKALGNIGTGMLDYAGLSKPYVVELSSFQLFYSNCFKAPHAAGLLNISSDHLDWHKDHEEYRSAKTKLFTRSREQISVLNYDDPFLNDFANQLPKLRFFSTKENLKEKLDEISKEKGASKVMACAYIKNNSLMLCDVLNNKLEMPIVNTEELKIVGDHNHANALAAILVTSALGISVETIREKLVSFEPVEHRLEYVTSIDGKKIYNDSKATNPDSAIKGVNAFEKCIAIVGGKEKNLDLKEYAAVLKEKAHTVIAIGEIKNRFKDELKDLNYENVIIAESLEDAVKAALDIPEAIPVLLAPASSSFDMFKSFAKRGEIFKEIVQNIKVNA